MKIYNKRTNIICNKKERKIRTQKVDKFNKYFDFINFIDIYSSTLYVYSSTKILKYVNNVIFSLVTNTKDNLVT